MWHLKTTVEPIIDGSQSKIKKGTDKHIDQMPGSPSQYEIQKIALWGTAHLLWRVLLIWLKKKQPKEKAKNKYIEYT